MSAWASEFGILQSMREMAQAPATLKRRILHVAVTTVTLSYYVQEPIQWKRCLPPLGQIFSSALRLNVCALRVAATLPAARCTPSITMRRITCLLT